MLAMPVRAVREIGVVTEHQDSRCSKIAGQLHGSHAGVVSSWRAMPMQIKFARCSFAIGPARSGKCAFLAVTLPPLIIAGIEHIGPGGELPCIVCDDSRKTGKIGREYVRTPDTKANI